MQVKIKAVTVDHFKSAVLLCISVRIKAALVIY